MPIYEYACRCGHAFERLVPRGSEPPPCPVCAAPTEKKVSRAGFILQGGGWYKDHYGLKPSAASGDGGAKEGKSETKTEGASKTESAPSSAPAPAPASPSTTNGPSQ